jgi:hypothetical protein
MKNYSKFIAILVTITVFSCQEAEFVKSTKSDILANASSRSTSKVTQDLINRNLNNIEQKEELEVKNGIFRFKNPSAFLDFFKEIDKNKKEFDSRFKKEFLVNENRINNIRKEFETAKTESEISNILLKNQDYIYLKDSTVNIINSTPYDFLFTEPAKNYFFIGKMIYLMEKDATYLIIDGDEEKIAKCKKKIGIIENVIVNSKEQSKNKKAKPQYTIPISEFIISGRVLNGNIRRGTAGVKISGPEYVAFGTNANGQPVFSVKYLMQTQGYPERRTLGIWFNVNSLLSLSVNYNSRILFNGTQVGSNQSMAKPKLVGPFTNSEINHYEFMYGVTPTGGVFLVTQAQQSQISATVTSNGGFFNTGQVPGVNILY